MNSDLINKIRKLNFISEYNVKKGGLLYESRNAEGWIPIGIIPKAAPLAKLLDLYIMLSPDAPNDDTIDKIEFIDRYILLNTKEDGTGITFTWSSIPSNKKRYMKLFPEYENSNYSVYFFGKKVTKDDELKHKEFMKLLDIQNGKVLLKHDSDEIIKDGVIYYGTKRSYSSDKDVGVYFWGSKESGSDPSNYNRFRYFCYANIEDIYDFETNMERFRDITNVWHNYKYAAQRWKGTDAVVVNADSKTPIAYIIDKTTGEKYDSEWNKIN